MVRVHDGALAEEYHQHLNYDASQNLMTTVTVTSLLAYYVLSFDGIQCCV